jgi:NADPH:quinone reductase-like Zn-dependent oxidoreductase
MRAVAVKEFGGTPERMELPKPVPGPGEVLIHVGTAGVNPFDWKISDGLLKDAMPHVFPLVLGVDGSGVVEGVGEGVTRLKLNDGVYGSFLHAPVGGGSYAEYVTVPESNAIAIRPRGMYNDPAAAVPTPGMTALQALDELGLQKRQNLLVLGAAGGVGSFVVQLAANQGIQVAATARGATNRDYVLKFGAMRFFDSSEMTYRESVHAAYPDGVDAVLELRTTADDFAEMYSFVRPGGSITSTVHNVDVAKATSLGLKGWNINLEPQVERLDRLSAEYTKGRLRIPLEQKAPLDSAPDVIQASRNGTLRGKTVLVV